MFFLRIIHFFLGYVKFSARGDFPERFLNLLTRSEARIWDARIKEKVLYCYVIAKDYKLLRPLARKTRVKVRIEKKKGLPFFTYRHRKRIGIYCGVVIFMVTIIILSLSVWSIEISGNKFVTKKEILKSLKENGIYVGSFKKNIDGDEIAQKLIMNINKLSYATIYIRGSVAEVKVREQTEKIEKVPDGSPSNIVSDLEGEILSIDVYDGTAMVKRGQKVTKGAILVSGILENKVKNNFVYSNAKIVAKTKTEIKVTIPLKYDAYVLKNNSYRRRSLYFFGVRVPLYVGRLPKYNYNIFDITENLTFFEREMPVGFYTEYYYPSEKTEITLSPVLAKRLSTAICTLREIEELGESDIINKKTIGDETSSAIILKYQYECKEEIGVHSPIKVED